MLVTVGPTFPGLINTINPAAKVGDATYLFDIAWIYGVSFSLHVICMFSSITSKFVVASTVYYITSVLFPARETFVEKLILTEDAALDHARGDSPPIDALDGKENGVEDDEKEV